MTIICPGQNHLSFPDQEGGCSEPTNNRRSPSHFTFTNNHWKSSVATVTNHGVLVVRYHVFGKAFGGVRVETTQSTVTPLAGLGDSTQLSHTQKRTVKRILIRCGSHGYSANFHAVGLCSHVRFCVCDGHVPSLARGVTVVCQCFIANVFTLWGPSFGLLVNVIVSNVGDDERFTTLPIRHPFLFMDKTLVTM